MNNQLAFIVSQLLKRNNISFDKKELEFQIQSHPSYPSLYAVTGVLNHFNIENIAAQVELSSAVLGQLPECFLAQVNEAHGQNLVVVRKKDVGYVINDGVKKKITLLKEEFIQKFTGIILAVEKNHKEGPSDWITALSKSYPFLFLAVPLFYLPYHFSISMFTYFHLLLSIIGILFSVVIVKHEIGIQTTIGNAFCSGTNSKKDCDAVLTSKGAEIIKGYKLSDFSLLYFITLLLLTIFSAARPEVPYTLSLLAIPVTIYSIYYQQMVVKKWCLLCLTIVGVLWLQAVVVLYAQNVHFRYTIADMVLLIFMLSLVTILWGKLKPFIEEVHTLRKEKIKATKFRRNYIVFKSLLNIPATLVTQLDELEELIYGNKEAKLEIVVITNPFCGHCKPVHQIVEDILSQYTTEVKIIIRFNVNPANIESDTVTISTRLLEIYKEDKSKCLEAMSAIYGGIPVTSWLTKWGSCNEKEEGIVTLKKQHNWCTANTINFTPEILINGKPYPKEYNKSDLIYFMEDLIENVI